MAGILAILGTAMALRLTLPLLLGRFADDALSGEPTSALTSVALLYVAAALGSAAKMLLLGQGNNVTQFGKRHELGYQLSGFDKD